MESCGLQNGDTLTGNTYPLERDALQTLETRRFGWETESSCRLWHGVSAKYAEKSRRPCAVYTSDRKRDCVSDMCSEMPPKYGVEVEGRPDLTAVGVQKTRSLGFRWSHSDHDKCLASGEATWKAAQDKRHRIESTLARPPPRLVSKAAFCIKPWV